MAGLMGPAAHGVCEDRQCSKNEAEQADKAVDRLRSG